MKQLVDKIKTFLRREPVVVINSAVAAIVAGHQAVAADIDPTDGWAAIGWAVLAYVVRTQVTPAVKT